MHGKSLKTLNKVKEFLDRFDFFDHLQAIVNRNWILWAYMMPKKEVFQMPPICFYSLLTLYKWFTQRAMFQDCLNFEKIKTYKTSFSKQV